jgi:hypothetical protein
MWRKITSRGLPVLVLYSEKIAFGGLSFYGDDSLIWYTYEVGIIGFHIIFSLN